MKLAFYQGGESGDTKRNLEILEQNVQIAADHGILILNLNLNFIFNNFLNFNLLYYEGAHFIVFSELFLCGYVYISSLVTFFKKFLP